MLKKVESRFDTFIKDSGQKMQIFHVKKIYQAKIQ